MSQSTTAERLPAYARSLFDAKAAKGLSFEAVAQHLERSEVACAALFYGQATASAEDVERLSQLLDLPKESLAAQMTTGFPNRGQAGPMPPTEPLIYRLYEIVQNYGYAYKAILNEKFGDGIMSAICFSTTVDKEVDEAGSPWVVITLKGKWYVQTKNRIVAQRLPLQVAFQSFLSCAWRLVSFRPARGCDDFGYCPSSPRRRQRVLHLRSEDSRTKMQSLEQMRV